MIEDAGWSESLQRLLSGRHAYLHLSMRECWHAEKVGVQVGGDSSSSRSLPIHRHVRWWVWMESLTYCQQQMVHSSHSPSTSFPYPSLDVSLELAGWLASRSEFFRESDTLIIRGGGKPRIQGEISRP